MCHRTNDAGEVGGTFHSAIIGSGKSPVVTVLEVRLDVVGLQTSDGVRRRVRFPTNAAL